MDKEIHVLNHQHLNKAVLLIMKLLRKIANLHHPPLNLSRPLPDCHCVQEPMNFLPRWNFLCGSFLIYSLYFYIFKIFILGINFSMYLYKKNKLTFYKMSTRSINEVCIIQHVTFINRWEWCGVCRIFNGTTYVVTWAESMRCCGHDISNLHQSVIWR